MTNSAVEKLIQALSIIEDKAEMETFLSELCSELELSAIAERLQVAEMLCSGKMYSDIAASMDVSSSLIAKVESVMQQGPGGFKLALKKIKESENKRSYADFASLYDTFTYDVEYSRRLDYVETLLKNFSDIPVNTLLDLACGTGTTSVMLHDRGYEVIAVDSSAEMLAVARTKKEDRDILFLNQEMRDFELYGTVDGVICLLDSVNYVIEEDDLLSCFKWVNNYLNPGGVFVFDINTKHKLENVLAGNVFVDERDGVFYSWENYYDDEENICEFDLNFFVKEGSKYKRFNEVHYERAYTTSEIKFMLKKSGLKFLAMYDDLTENAPGKTSERIFFVAKKL